MTPDNTQNGILWETGGCLVVTNKQKANRKEFFEKFIGMFGGPGLRVTQENTDFIVGELIWLDDAEAVEEIRWDCAESDVPSLTCFRLITLIEERDLLEIDMITIPRKQLHESFSRHMDETVSFLEFESALEELLAIKMPVLDGGQETDAYFVHE